MDLCDIILKTASTCYLDASTKLKKELKKNGGSVNKRSDLLRDGVLTLSFYVSLSVPLSLSLSLSLLCLYICPSSSHCFSIILPLSIPLSLCLSVSLCLFLSLCLPVSLSVSLSLSLSLSPCFSLAPWPKPMFVTKGQYW